MLGPRFGITASVAFLLTPLALAQFPPAPEGVTVLQSKFADGVTISYKEPGICETTPGVKSYAGYIHLPPGSLGDLGAEQDYPINTFFWFFEARKDPENAPLSIWMNGGPGSSSMLGLLSENGPCFINPESNSTTLNPWSWNNEVNMLYLDQPVQVGFSYDVLANATKDLVNGTITKLNDTDEIPQQNTTFLVGTFPSQDRNSTARGTRNAAFALWHFAQTWFQEFPGYRPNDSRISISTESYGGRYGPGFTAFFEEQNERIANGTWESDGLEARVLNLDTLLIVNGCVDRRVQWPTYAHFAHNNTYGIEAVNASVYAEMVEAYGREGGCRDQIDLCREVALVYDPDNTGVNETVNALCEDAETFCTENIRNRYTTLSGRNYYDVATVDPAPFPDPFYRGYLNQPHVQRALGVPVNFTQSSSVVASAFRGIGDYPRPGHLEDLEYLLNRGIKVALMYGDRDFACNWLGGEAVSLAIDHEGGDAFRAAGYTDIRVNDSYVGGQVRQHGNLSFSRVFQAGHEVPSYQPETAYRIFMRALFNRDVATGVVDTVANASYSSEGTRDTWYIKNEEPPELLKFCYLFDMGSTCTEDQISSVLKGTATVRSWIVVDRNSTELYPGLMKPGGGANSTSTTTTGLPTATGTQSTPTPSESSGAGAPLSGSGVGYLAVAGAVAQVIMVA